jgi:hypothetical protein
MNANQEALTDMIRRHRAELDALHPMADRQAEPVGVIDVAAIYARWDACVAEAKAARPKPVRIG